MQVSATFTMNVFLASPFGGRVAVESFAAMHFAVAKRFPFGMSHRFNADSHARREVCPAVAGMQPASMVFASCLTVCPAVDDARAFASLVWVGVQAAALTASPADTTSVASVLENMFVLF